MLLHVTGELEKGLIAAAVIFGIVVFGVVAVVVVGGCGAARHIVRQRVRKEDAVNLPEHMEINNVSVQHERKVPLGETESKPCPVQERVRGIHVHHIYQLTVMEIFTVVT